jgi:hypothetical protein
MLESGRNAILFVGDEYKPVELGQVDHERRLARVLLDVDGEPFEWTADLADLFPDNSDPDILRGVIRARIETSLRNVARTRRRRWWARQAHLGAKPSLALLQRFYEKAAEIDDEVEIFVDVRLYKLDAHVSARTARQLLDWWADNREPWLKLWRLEAQRRGQKLLDDLVSEDRLNAARARVRAEVARVGLDADDVEETARSRVLAQILERGEALRDACDDTFGGLESPPAA